MARSYPTTGWASSTRDDRVAWACYDFPMCGRYALHANPHVVALQFGLPVDPGFESRYNIAPSLNILIVMQNAAGQRLADHYRWGLIPGWMKDPSIGNRLANARGETVAEKPAPRHLRPRTRRRSGPPERSRPTSTTAKSRPDRAVSGS